MKVVWKGSLSFGLVNIPVNLYPATQSHSLGFKLLHAHCHTPINYERWCPHCKKDVAWSDIVKGIKLKNGDYFILTEENLKKLRPEKTDTIDIVEFVDSDAIDPIYFDHHYYVMPSKENEKAFFLFIESLKRSNRVAIGRFVLRDKEYVGALQPFKTGILLTTLNYNYEIREFKKIEELKAPKLSAAELKLARQLIDQLYQKKFDMNQFKDTFVQTVQKQLKELSSGKKKKKVILSKVKKIKMKQPSLMHILQESLKEQGVAHSKSR